MITTVFVNAQDTKAIKKMVDAKELDKALQAVDALIAKDNKKAENWYWKSKVYNAIADSDKFKNLIPDAKWKAFEAIRQYTSMEKDLKTLLVDDPLNSTKIFDNYYNTFRNAGAANLDAKNYSDAHTSFKNALEVYKIYVDQKWTQVALDTSIVFYAGYTAMMAKNNEDAEIYFKKLSDANVTGTDIQMGYGWLANYYLNDKKDIAKGKEYLDKGLKFYPKDEYLLGLNEDLILKSGDWNSIFANYEKGISKPTPVFNDYLNYAISLYQYLYEDSTKKS